MTASDDGDESSRDPEPGCFSAVLISGFNRYSKVTPTAAIRPGGRLHLKSASAFLSF
jgi:hypothetical protein